MKLRIRKENTKFSFPIDVMMTKKRESTNLAFQQEEK